VQESQLQFYDAIEWFTSDSDTDEESDENNSDLETNSTENTNLLSEKFKSIESALLAGNCWFGFFEVFVLMVQKIFQTTTAKIIREEINLIFL
jgi:hypothetical protein